MRWSRLFSEETPCSQWGKKIEQCVANGCLFLCNKLKACVSFPVCWLDFQPLSHSLSPPSFYASLQDCGVISSGAYQPSLGNCLQVLSLQQGRLRPLCLLPPPTPVQEDVHWHHQQAAETQLLERVWAPAWEPGQQHTRRGVTVSALMGRLTRQLSGKYEPSSRPCLLEIGLQKTKKQK